MNKVFARAAAMLALLAPITTASAQHGPVGHYTAFLSEGDHYNSNGVRLTSAAAIIRQDRANVHRYGSVDNGDEFDGFFANANNRARLERMLNAGSASPGTRNAIVNGEVMIHVDIWSDSINVTVY